MKRLYLQHWNFPLLKLICLLFVKNFLNTQYLSSATTHICYANIALRLYKYIDSRSRSLVCLLDVKICQVSPTKQNLSFGVDFKLICLLFVKNFLNTCHPLQPIYAIQTKHWGSINILIYIDGWSRSLVCLLDVMICQVSPTKQNLSFGVDFKVWVPFVNYV